MASLLRKAVLLGALSATLLLAGSTAASPTHALPPPTAYGYHLLTRANGYDFDIVAMNADGTGRTRLTSGPDDDFAPDWSPDGSTIAFDRTDASSDDHEIFAIDADGSKVRDLSNDPVHYDYEASWSPSGARIAFTRTPVPDRDFDIWTMDADGTHQTQITKGPAWDWYPDFSPDGTRIVFSRSDQGHDIHIWVMNADGTGQTQLTNGSEDDRLPSWSPDGTRITFSRGNPDDIYVMNADGSGVTNLTDNGWAEDGPEWSPTGGQIAYDGVTGYSFDIFVMNDDGSAQTNLTGTDDIDEYWPTWSPDGARLAFGGSGFGPPPCRVPRVIGMSLRPAKRRIRKARCSVGSIRRTRSRRVGHVIAQRPRPGTRLVRRPRVLLVVGRR